LNTEVRHVKGLDDSFFHSLPTNKVIVVIVFIDHTVVSLFRMVGSLPHDLELLLVLQAELGRTRRCVRKLVRLDVCMKGVTLG